MIAQKLHFVPKIPEFHFGDTDYQAIKSYKNQIMVEYPVSPLRCIDLSQNLMKKFRLPRP
jgi:hypothetical protein